MIPASPHYSFFLFHHCSFHFSNTVFVTTLFTSHSWFRDGHTETPSIHLLQHREEAKKQEHRYIQGQNCKRILSSAGQRWELCQEWTQEGSADKKTKPTGNCDFSFWPGIDQKRVGGRVPAYATTECCHP